MTDDLTNLLIGFKEGICPLEVLCEWLEENRCSDVSNFIKLLDVATIDSGRVSQGYVAVIRCPRTMWNMRWVPFDRIEFSKKEDAESCLRSSIVVYIREALGNG